MIVGLNTGYPHADRRVKTGRTSEPILPDLAETGPQPLTTPSGVSRLVGRTSDVEAAMTDSMSL